MAVQVGAPETAMRQRVKRAGGQWDVQQQVWKLRYDRAVALALDGTTDHSGRTGSPRPDQANLH